MEINGALSPVGGMSGALSSVAGLTGTLSPAAGMSGTLSDRGRVTGTLSPAAGLSGTLSVSAGLAGRLTVPSTVGVQIYDGTYDVTPQARSDVVLDTENRFLEQDVTVREIPYYTTTNISGGYTAVIGG